jgi:hypothetical protein
MGVVGKCVDVRDGYPDPAMYRRAPNSRYQSMRPEISGPKVWMATRRFMITPTGAISNSWMTKYLTIPPERNSGSASPSRQAANSGGSRRLYIRSFTRILRPEPMEQKQPLHVRSTSVNRGSSANAEF